MNVNINKEWNYKDIIKNIRKIKDDYNKILSSFSITCEENAFILATRTKIYSLNLEEFEKDRVWEYINGDLSSLDAFILFRIWD